MPRQIEPFESRDSSSGALTQGSFATWRKRLPHEDQQPGFRQLRRWRALAGTGYRSRLKFPKSTSRTATRARSDTAPGRPSRIRPPNVSPGIRAPSTNDAVQTLPGLAFPTRPERSRRSNRRRREPSGLRDQNRPRLRAQAHLADSALRRPGKPQPIPAEQMLASARRKRRRKILFQFRPRTSTNSRRARLQHLPDKKERSRRPSSCQLTVATHFATNRSTGGPRHRRSAVQCHPPPTRISMPAPDGRILRCQLEGLPGPSLSCQGRPARLESTPIALSIYCA